MATDHTQHGRRPHGHRRRGHDRRGADRRPRTPPQEDGGRERVERDRVDVDQIMREIRARIAERKGVDLSNQQILDLAARRLESVLAPQGLDPRLMEELRLSAGAEATRPLQAEPVEPFHAASLYHSSNALVRALRSVFRPLLSLLIDPKALAAALGAQAELAAKQASREAEQRRRQSEWNALHYEILRRVVTDAARAEIDLQDLLLRVESLAARVDFADRRVGAIEQAQHQARPVRGAEVPVATTDGGEQTPRPDAESADGSRRRRRRRRGRRSGGGQLAEGPTGETLEAASPEDDGHDVDETAGGAADAVPDGTGQERESAHAAGGEEVPVATEPAGAASTETDAGSTDAPVDPPRAIASPQPEAPPVAQGWVPPSRPEPVPAQAPVPDDHPTPVASPPAPATSHTESGPGSESSDRPQSPAPEPGPGPSSTDR